MELRQSARVDEMSYQILVRGGKRKKGQSGPHDRRR